MAFFDKNKTGELINRLSSDASLVSQCLTSNVSDALRSSVLCSAGIGMMVYMSPQLAMVGLAIVPPVGVLSVGYGRFVRKITQRVQDSLAAATQVAEERIANIRTVRAFGQETREFERYNEKIKQLMELAYREAWAKGTFFALVNQSLGLNLEYNFHRLKFHLSDGSERQRHHPVRALFRRHDGH